MYLPDIYQAFSERFPAVFKDYKQLGITTRQAGPLDEKTQDLVKLGIAIGANSQGGVMSQVGEVDLFARKIAHRSIPRTTTCRATPASSKRALRGTRSTSHSMICFK